MLDATLEQVAKFHQLLYQGISTLTRQCNTGHKMEQDWKSNYAKEIQEHRDKIIVDAKIHWGSIGTRSSEEKTIIDRGGILSFPHTFIEDSLESLLEVIGAIHSAGKKGILALGVLHKTSVDAESKEFSLEGLVRVAELYERANNLPHLTITKRYHPPLDRKLVESEEFIALLGELALELKKIITPDMAIVMTGDLAHYGYGYGTQEPKTDNLNSELLKQITECLDTIYLERNFESFIRKSYELKSDQIGPPILASMLLSHPLAYSIFSFVLSDYSLTLQSQKPTLVASVCYGVFSRQ